jgi:4-carboxymuconolactone decarboxylase
MENVANILRRLKRRYRIRSMTAQRIPPLEAPYAAEVEAALAKWMPPGSPVPPLALFRVIARHPMLRERMRPLGSGLLSHGELPPRVRELLILRTTARCGAEYEWGIHAAAFAAGAGLSAEDVRGTATESAAAIASRVGDDAVVLRAADELHDRGALEDATFCDLHARFGDAGLLELAVVCGFYHAIAFIVGVARIQREPWARSMPAIAEALADGAAQAPAP